MSGKYTKPSINTRPIASRYDGPSERTAEVFVEGMFNSGCLVRFINRDGTLEIEVSSVNGTVIVNGTPVPATR